MDTDKLQTILENKLAVKDVALPVEEADERMDQKEDFVSCSR